MGLTQMQTTVRCVWVETSRIVEGKVDRRMLRHTRERNGTEWSGVPPFVSQTEKVSGPT